MSTNDLMKFREEAIERFAHIIADSHTGSEITRLFARSGYPKIQHVRATKWKFVAGALLELQEVYGGPQHVLKVLQTLLNPQGWIGNREGFEYYLKSINEILEFYGLKIDDEGKIIRFGKIAKTVRMAKSDDEILFEARAFHPQVVKHGRHHFSRSAYFHAVFECCKAFDTSVKKSTGIDDSGQSLMGRAFCLNGPLKLNTQITRSERNEQEGIMYLCKGLMNAVRNPQAHEPELDWPMTREDALDVLTLVSFLFRRLENAVVVRDGTAGIHVEL